MSVHRRDRRMPTAAVCGAGYPWPSTIALTDDPGLVDCPSCALREEGGPGPVKRYLVFSDGSETGGTPAYGIAYEDTRMPHDWVWEETLPTADQAEASRLVAARGYVATPISGGWYGDARDDTYALLVPGGQCEACGDKTGGHAPDCTTLRT